MTIDRIKTLVGQDFEAVNTLILNEIQAQAGLVDELSNHIIQSGGKRLRPLLVLLSSLACDYRGQEHITLAAMIEFFHTATLLHDDVIDESTLRRGRETANKIWGSKASILVGDFLYTLYMRLMIDIGNLDIMRLLTDIGHQMACGEIKQLSNRNKSNLALHDYFDVIRSKTSLLFAAAPAIGALISNANHETQQAMYTYGLHLGNAFQLIDDTLDYCSDVTTLGKNIGDDLADGKATLPLLYAQQHGTSAEQRIIKESLEKGTLSYLPEILNAIASTNAIHYTKEIATIEINRSIMALEVVSNSVYKEALIELAHYAIARDH